MSSLKRVFFSQAVVVDSSLEIAGDMFHHLFRVCRLEVGDDLIAVDDAYREFSAKVILVDKDRATIALENFDPMAITAAVLRGQVLHLYIALLKGEAFDWAIEKAVELVESEITPVVFSRSVVKLDSEQILGKMNRWQKMIQKAAQQSRQLALPTLHVPITVSDLLQAEAGSSELRLLCNEHEKDVNLRQFEQGFDQYAIVSVVTGPEGGFTREETDGFKFAGWNSISLGTSILRAETAPMVALAQLQLLKAVGYNGASDVASGH